MFKKCVGSLKQHPNQSRQVSAHLESGSVWGFCLLKREFSLPTVVDVWMFRLSSVDNWYNYISISRVLFRPGRCGLVLYVKCCETIPDVNWGLLNKNGTEIEPLKCACICRWLEQSDIGAAGVKRWQRKRRMLTGKMSGEKSEVKIVLHQWKMDVLLETDRRITAWLESGTLKVETRDQQQFLERKTEEKTTPKASCSGCPVAKQETGGEEVQSRKRRTRSPF